MNSHIYKYTYKVKIKDPVATEREIECLVEQNQQHRLNIYMSFCIVLLKRIEKHSAPEFMYRVCLKPCTSIYYLLEFGKIFGFSIDMICNLQIFKLSMFYFEQYFVFVQFQ